MEPGIDFEKKKDNLKLLSKISVDDLQKIAGENVEIVSLVLNEENTIVGFKREDVDFSELPAKEFLHTSVMTIPPGAYKCRVVIRNLETGRGAIGISSVYIPQHRN